MPDIRLLTITDSILNHIQQHPDPVQQLFRSFGGDWNIKRREMSSQLADLLFWRDVEKRLSPLERNKVLLLFAPVFALTYANIGQTANIYWMLPIGLLMATLGALMFWLQSSAGKALKLKSLRKGFVVLVGNVLVENLPQHRLLLRERSRLQQLLSQAQAKKQELKQLHVKLIEKSRALQEDSSELINALRNEAHQIDTVFQNTQLLLQELNAQLARFETQRKVIVQRAELEYIRSQARALTKEDQARFSTQALTELQLDAIGIQQRINEVEYELGRQGIRYELENQYSV